MILVTGGTGFIGKAVIRQLIEEGYEVRMLVRPSKKTTRLQGSAPIEIALSNIHDEINLRAAMIDVDTIIHLVGGEWQDPSIDLAYLEIEGTKNLIACAKDAGVKRIIYLSHLGANRQAGFPVLRVKGETEALIMNSGIDFTIVRSSLVFGNGDHFTTAIAKVLSGLPFLFLVPGQGNMLLQPIWVEDLATALVWSIEKETAINRVSEVGGPELFTFVEIVHMIMERLRKPRILVHIRAAYMMYIAVIFEYFFPAIPINQYWIDYLATNRTADLDTITKEFGILPARLKNHLVHLDDVNWGNQFRIDNREKREARKQSF